MTLVAMVPLAYMVQSLVVAQVRPCTSILSFCILNTCLAIQLSYIMSQYYEDQGKKATACDFSGNALINPSAPSSLSATAAASSCISNPSATFAPTSPATAGAGSTSTGTSNKSGSASLVGNLDAIIGMSVLAIIGVMSAVWTLV